jgi:acyl-CoA reductase-like NAD-dependent aldehyde dehydrogenase
MSFIQKG